MTFTFKSVLLALTVTAAAFTGTACAAPHEKKADRQAILIASFGTSVPAGRVAIDNLVEETKKAFPGTEVPAKAERTSPRHRYRLLLISMMKATAGSALFPLTSSPVLSTMR